MKNKRKRFRGARRPAATALSALLLVTSVAPSFAIPEDYTLRPSYELKLDGTSPVGAGDVFVPVAPVPEQDADENEDQGAKPGIDLMLPELQKPIVSVPEQDPEEVQNQEQEPDVQVPILPVPEQDADSDIDLMLPSLSTPITTVDAVESDSDEMEATPSIMSITAGQEYTADSIQTLREALTSATDGDTIRLTGDIDGDGSSIMIPASITLDLDTHAIRGKGAYKGFIQLTGASTEVTIKNGTIEAESGCQAIGVLANMELTLEGLTVNAKGSNNAISVPYANARNAHVHVVSGTYEGGHQFPVVGAAKDTFTFDEGVIIKSRDKSDFGMTSQAYTSSSGYGAELPEGCYADVQMTDEGRTLTVKRGTPPTLEGEKGFYHTLADAIAAQETSVYITQTLGSVKEQLEKVTIPAGYNLTLVFSTNQYDGPLFYYGDIHVDGTLTYSGNDDECGILGQVTFGEQGKLQLHNTMHYGLFATDLTENLPADSGLAMEPATTDDDVACFKLVNATIQGEQRTYATVTQAIQKGETNITLLDDHSENIDTTGAKGPITLNLGNHTLSGAITGKNAVLNVAQGTELTVTGGTLKSTKNYFKGEEYVAENHGKLTLNGLTINGADAPSHVDGGPASNISRNALIRSYGDLTITGGHISNTLMLEPNGAPDGIPCDGGIGVMVLDGTAQLTDVYIYAGYNGVYCCGGKTTITGDSTQIQWAGNSMLPPTAEGRTVCAVAADSPEMVTITGGKFNSNVSEYVPDGYIARNDSGSGDSCQVVKLDSGSAEEVVTDSIRVIFLQDVHIHEGNEYEIVLETAGEQDAIYGFLSASLAFEFADSQAQHLSYEITPASDMEMTAPQDGSSLYTFKYSGDNANGLHGNRVVLGTVRFSGMGTAKFQCDTDAEGIMVSTKTFGSSDLRTYDTDGEGDQLILNPGAVSDAGENVTVSGTLTLKLSKIKMKPGDSLELDGVTYTAPVDGNGAALSADENGAVTVTGGATAKTEAGSEFTPNGSSTYQVENGEGKTTFTGDGSVSSEDGKLKFESNSGSNFTFTESEDGTYTVSGGSVASQAGNTFSADAESEMTVQNGPDGLSVAGATEVVSESGLTAEAAPGGSLTASEADGGLSIEGAGSASYEDGTKLSAGEGKTLTLSEDADGALTASGAAQAEAAGGTVTAGESQEMEVKRDSDGTLTFTGAGEVKSQSGATYEAAEGEDVTVSQDEDGNTTVSGVTAMTAGDDLSLKADGDSVTVTENTDGSYTVAGDAKVTASDGVSFHGTAGAEGEAAEFTVTPPSMADGESVPGGVSVQSGKVDVTFEQAGSASLAAGEFSGSITAKAGTGVSVSSDGTVTALEGTMLAGNAENGYVTFKSGLKPAEPGDEDYGHDYSSDYVLQPGESVTIDGAVVTAGEEEVTLTFGEDGSVTVSGSAKVALDNGVVLNGQDGEQADSAFSFTYDMESGSCKVDVSEGTVQADFGSNADLTLGANADEALRGEKGASVTLGSDGSVTAQDDTMLFGDAESGYTARPMPSGVTPAEPGQDEDQKSFVLKAGTSTTIGDDTITAGDKDVTVTFDKDSYTVTGDASVKTPSGVTVQSKGSGDTQAGLKVQQTEGGEVFSVQAGSADVTFEQDSSVELGLKDGAATLTGSAGTGVTLGSDGSVTAKSGTTLTGSAESGYTATVTQSSGGSSSGGSSSSGGGSHHSGGGSSSSSSSRVKVETAEHGKVSVSPKNPGRGTTVTVTVTPDEGYSAGIVGVTDSKGNAVDVKEKSKNVFTFTMPANPVTVKVSFNADNYPGTVDPEPAALPFLDVQPGDWFYSSVQYVYERGIMAGESAQTFAPHMGLTRGMLVTMLYGMEGSPDGETVSFPDVASDAWYAKAVSWAQGLGLVTGYPNGNFGPDDLVTREQMAVILYRYATFYSQFSGKAITTNGDLSAFTDGTSVSGYAKTAMQWAVGNNLMVGDGSVLMPGSSATRAQAAVVLSHFDKDFFPHN